MTTESQALAYCRQPLELCEIISFISALSSTRKYDDPVSVALDACYERLQDIAAEQENAALWAADDKACRRAESLVPASSIPSFLRSAA